MEAFGDLSDNRAAMQMEKAAKPAALPGRLDSRAGFDCAGCGLAARERNIRLCTLRLLGQEGIFEGLHEVLL